ncbi:MAG: aminoglycoside phosphotransferase family protein [Pseudomonadota bacterium]
MEPSTFSGPSAVLACFPDTAGLGWRHLEPGGLINTTWQVGEPPRFVLQRVNAIFPEAIHARIREVTEHIAGLGLPTPRLLAAPGGRFTLPGPEGTRWRLMDFVPGRTHERMASPAMAAEAGALVGRFHRAMLSFRGDLTPLRPDPHDTPRHMAALEAVIEACGDHRLATGIRALGAHVLAGWERWRARFGLGGLPVRAAHGDLKLSNLRFDDDDRAVCLLDLDTLSSMPLACELGDALRSWCNRAGEGGTGVDVDLEIFAAALSAWHGAAGFATPTELGSIAGGTWRICLELAARFGADAYHERYFGWDPAQAAGRGEHNLIRAESQLALAEAVERRLPELERIVHSLV